MTFRAAVRRWALGVAGAAVLLTLLGFATFGRHPELLVRWPQAAPFYGVAYRFFALGQVWIAWASLAVVLQTHVGARWWPAFGLLYGISLASEWFGTGYGLPFGPYRYSALLAPMWGGRVPVVILLSWFFMALPAYAWAAGRWARPWARVAWGSALLAAWDFALDPAMSYVTRYWSWGTRGPYYGMPWSNLVGWYLTGVALMAALAAVRAERWTVAVPDRWWRAYYATNLALPVGMCVVAGVWGAVAATAGILALVVALRGRRRPVVAVEAA